MHLNGLAADIAQKRSADMNLARKITEKMAVAIGTCLLLTLMLAPIFGFGDGFLDDDRYYEFEYDSATGVYSETKVRVSGLRNESATQVSRTLSKASATSGGVSSSCCTSDARYSFAGTPADSAFPKRYGERQSL